VICSLDITIPSLHIMYTVNICMCPYIWQMIEAKCRHSMKLQTRCNLHNNISCVEFSTDEHKNNVKGMKPIRFAWTYLSLLVDYLNKSNYTEWP
jgi:hypothetical protein